MTYLVIEKYWDVSLLSEVMTLCKKMNICTMPHTITIFHVHLLRSGVLPDLLLQLTCSKAALIQLPDSLLTVCTKPGLLLGA